LGLRLCLNVACCLLLALLHTTSSMVCGASCARSILGRKRSALSLLLSAGCTVGASMLLTVRRRQCCCYLIGCGAHETKVWRVLVKSSGCYHISDCCQAVSPSARLHSTLLSAYVLQVA
jgi:hypothetical protein